MPRPPAWKPRLIHPSGATSKSLAKISDLAELLFWKIIPQANDQGRLSGDIGWIKATICPRRKEITEGNLPGLLDELGEELIIIYTLSSEPVIQLTTWWEHQSPQWAYPSSYPPPEGWTDHLRYRKGRKVITENWPPS